MLWVRLGAPAGRVYELVALEKDAAGARQSLPADRTRGLVNADLLDQFLGPDPHASGPPALQAGPSLLLDRIEPGVLGQAPQVDAAAVELRGGSGRDGLGAATADRGRGVHGRYLRTELCRRTRLRHRWDYERRDWVLGRTVAREDRALPFSSGHWRWTAVPSVRRM